MEVQTQIFSLIGVAEDQQKAVKAVLDGLIAERAALAQERVTLLQQTDNIHALQSQALHAGATAASNTVKQAVKTAFENAATDAISTMIDASAPAIEKFSIAAGASSLVLTAAAKTMTTATGTFAQYAQWFRVRALVGVVLLGVALLGTIYGIARLTLPNAGQVDALNAQIVTAQATLDKLNKLGARADFATCDDNGKSRLCIRIDKAAEVYGKNKKGESYRIIAGY